MQIIHIRSGSKWIIQLPDTFTPEDAREMRRRVEDWLNGDCPVAVLEPGLRLVRIEENNGGNNDTSLHRR